MVRSHRRLWLLLCLGLRPLQLRCADRNSARPPIQFTLQWLHLLTSDTTRSRWIESQYCDTNQIDACHLLYTRLCDWRTYFRGQVCQLGLDVGYEGRLSEQSQGKSAYQNQCAEKLWWSNRRDATSLLIGHLESILHSWFWLRYLREHTRRSELDHRGRLNADIVQSELFKVSLHPLFGRPIWTWDTRVLLEASLSASWQVDHWLEGRVRLGRAQ